MASRKFAKDLNAEILQQHAIVSDAEIANVRTELAAVKSKYKSALVLLDRERQRADSIASLQNITGKGNSKRKKTIKTKATMVLLLSDWHCEERVDPNTVNGLNDFSLAVAEKRIDELLERFLVCLDHERQMADIGRVVIWLGGDFISGHIHEDTAELAELAPLAAIRWAGERLRCVIDEIAEEADEVLICTNAGNHGRSNFGKPRIGTELEHSFEQHLYLTMAQSETLPNVRWEVGAGHLTYLDVQGFTIRFHHGHAIKCSGAIGGIHTGVQKANLAWNATKQADLTCFGHYHQFSWLRAGKYVSNGSLIGHSAYGTKIKCQYEPPCQGAFVVDHHRHEVTKAFPIFCDRDLQERKKKK